MIFDARVLTFQVQAEKVFARFLDAVIHTSSTGRTFLFLCSLMMDCPLSNEELEALLNHLPGDVCQVTRSKGGVDTYTIYYRLVDAFLTQQSQSHATLTASQHLPSLRYGMHPNPQQPMMTATPGIFNTYDSSYLNSPWSQPSSSSSSSGKQLFERLKSAIEDKSKSWGTNFSLKKQFEVFDSEKKGKISLRTLQGTLQDMGVLLTPSEVQIVTAQFGQPEDDRAFCKGLDSFMGTAAPKPAEQKAASKPAEPTVITELPVTMVAQSQALPGFNVYVTQRVLQRVKELRREGRDPRDIFEANDLDRTGMVTVNQFKQIVSKLQLLQSEVQLSKAVEDCLSLSNKAMVVYDDFCNFLELAADDNRNLRVSVDGSGYDGVALRQSRSNLGYTSTAGMRGTNILFAGGDSDGPGDPFNRTTFSARSQLYPNELEEGSDYMPGSNSVQRSGRLGVGTLSPPKLTDSFNQSFRQQRWTSGTGNMNTPSRYLNSSGYAESIAEFSPRRSVSVPPISPSKAGSKMWGNRTPLSKKGHALKVDSNKWCCTVCMYVENPKDAQNCIVCDSPNYNANKDYQVREQCQNCTMLNGQFAEECEMCGEPLLAARGGSNTANGQYVNSLDVFVKINISQDSYVLNEGISGCDGYTFLVRSFPLEQLATEKWPNIVIEEFSINMGRQDWEFVFGFLERLNHYLLFKWTRKGLPMPAIYDKSAHTYMRGCPACPHFIDYGRTFRVPVWSWPDATYP
eukprot:gene23157-31476_t